MAGADDTTPSWPPRICSLYADISDADHLEELIRTGTPEEYLGRRVAYAQAVRQGFMTALTDDFRTLTGEDPQPIGEVIGELGLTRTR